MVPFNSSQWVLQSECPNCGNRSYKSRGNLAVPFYTFGNCRIALPPQGIEFRECGGCGLVYKSLFPSVPFLSEVMDREAGAVWSDPYSHSDDVDLIVKYAGKKEIDVLDVGASHGFLLKALAPHTTGRLSALDLVAYSGLQSALRGEFISGLLEDDALSWSGNPYDVVTAFDVFEHFYQPAKAFAQVARLLKPGGLLVLETGDTESGWPAQYGVSHWWYASWFVHHIFWTESSLAVAAKKAGFKIEAVVRRRHKSRREIGKKAMLKEAVKVGLYRASPAFYRWISKKADSSGIQPYSPWTVDHLFVVFKKIS